MMFKNFIFLIAVSSILCAQDNFSARSMITATDRTVLSSEIAGKIVYLPKAEGEYFTKGELLAKINCDVYQAQKNRASIQKDIAELKFKKDKQLDALRSIGSFEVLISQSEFKKSKTELEIAAINVRRCKLHAPFNGKIVSKNVNKYQTINKRTRC